MMENIRGIFVIALMWIHMNIQSIDVSHNFLSSIPSNLIKNNEEIWDMDFSYNQISEIDSQAFVDAKKLYLLDISHNLLNTIQPSIFTNNKYLWYADFSNNKISEINSLAFAATTQLSSINFSNNLLKIVSSNVFSNNKELGSIYLDGNNLHEVDSLCESDFPKLKVLSISRNNFSCSYLSHIHESCKAIKLTNQNHEKPDKEDGTDCVKD